MSDLEIVLDIIKRVRLGESPLSRLKPEQLLLALDDERLRLEMEIKSWLRFLRMVVRRSENKTKTMWRMRTRYRQRLAQSGAAFLTAD